jgi:hypothetical protein
MNNLFLPGDPNRNSTGGRSFPPRRPQIGIRGEKSYVLHLAVARMRLGALAPMVQ